MKLFFKSLLLWLIIMNNTFAQQATITEQKVKMKTYMFSDPDPVPDIGENYPYYRFDGYTNESAEKEWKMVILENDYIKVHITPEIGGKIWGAIEKSTGGEFLYFNDVVKFRDVAQRGPWTSGGLEFNFGIMGHVSTCSTPLDYVLSENPDGSVSCHIGALDLHTQTQWNVEILLPKDKAYVKTIATWTNTNEIPVSFYHYMNAAAKTSGNLEFIYPGSHFVGHGGEVGTWPILNGRDVSFYENNNFGSYKSYHVLNAYSNYFGGYWHDDQFGFGHLVDYSELPGKKLWIWGLSMQGMIWVDLLTDKKGQYIEYQAGKTFNQAMTRSSFTPFKHSEFIPYDTDITTELWFPLKGTGGMVAASEYAVLDVDKEKDHIVLKLSALQDLATELVVTAAEKVILQGDVQLKPLELYTQEIEMDTSMDFTVTLGNGLLYYSSKRSDLIVDRPLYANSDYDWNTAAGLFTQGFELEKQQSYIPGGDANRTAHEFYIKSLEVDPAFSPSLNRLALSYYKRMEYEKSLEYIVKSLAIDTYNPEANYIFGLINAKLDKPAEAKSGYSIATQSPAYRSAGNTKLAQTYLREKRYLESERFALKALDYNRHNVIAHEILALVYREMGKEDLLEISLAEISRINKTSAFLKFMNIRRKNGSMDELSKLITNELPHESYLDLAIRFHNYGFPEESIEILKSAPKHPVILMWLAYLDTDHRQEWLEESLNMSPDFVFPYRDETLVVLENLMQLNESWKLRYYAALIYWKKDRLEKARMLFEYCESKPDYIPYYLARALFFKAEDDLRLMALEKAGSLSDNNWRVNHALIDQYFKEEEYKLAADLAKSTLRQNPERSILGLDYAMALLQLGDYKECVDFLESFVVIPFEGATMGRRVYHEASIRAAMAELKRKKYKNAIKYTNKALLWPLNLGAGKPYETDERLEHYMLGLCNRELGNDVDAKNYFTKVSQHINPKGSRENALLYLQVKALNEMGRQNEAEDLLNKALQEAPDNEMVQWVKTHSDSDFSDTETKKMISDATEKSPTDNEFLLLMDLLPLIE